MTIDESGNFGIGTLLPDSKLEIEWWRIHATYSSTSKWVAWLTQQTSWWYGIYQDGADWVMNYFKGNVWIGTITPSAKLDVNGEIKFGDTDVNIEGAVKYVSELNDFCWYNGSFWFSLTGKSSCGNTCTFNDSGEIALGCEAL